MTASQFWESKGEAVKLALYNDSLSVIDSRFRRPQERSMRHLDAGAQFFLKHGGRESGEEYGCFEPPEWAPPVHPADVLDKDGNVVLRCPQPDAYVRPGTPYPLLGHWLGNDHPLTQWARVHGEEAVAMDSADMQALPEEDATKRAWRHDERMRRLAHQFHNLLSESKVEQDKLPASLLSQIAPPSAAPP